MVIKKIIIKCMVILKTKNYLPGSIFQNVSDEDGLEGDDESEETEKEENEVEESEEPDEEPKGY